MLKNHKKMNKQKRLLINIFKYQIRKSYLMKEEGKTELDRVWR